MQGLVGEEIFSVFAAEVREFLYWFERQSPRRRPFADEALRHLYTLRGDAEVLGMTPLVKVIAAVQGELCNGADDPRRLASTIERSVTEALRALGWDMVRTPGTNEYAVHLHPGKVYVGSEATLITTILGSCVAVCLYDPRARIGGMNHYLLACQSGAGDLNRFGDFAIRNLVTRMIQSGAGLHEMEAKVFGGASMLQGMRLSKRSLGEENALIAQDVLDMYGIPIIEHDTGGDRGRKLAFETATGRAYVKLI